MASKGVRSWSLTAASNILANTGVAMSGTDLASVIDNSIRQFMADHVAERNLLAGRGATAGSANAYTFDTTQANVGYPTAWASPYVHGDRLSFEANFSNTGACTLNVDGIGAKSIKKNHDQDPASGDIESGGIYTVVYDSGDDAFQLLSPIAAAAQPLTATLTAIGALTPTDSNIIVGNGTTWVAESGDTARTSLGLGTGNAAQFMTVNVGHASDSTLGRTSAGLLNVEGVDLVGVSLSQTLTNKTLTSPTINGAALSGTFSGTPTFSGAVTFSAAGPTITLLSASSPYLLVQDSTNNCQAYYQALDSKANFGTLSNHPAEVVINAALAATFAVGGNFTAVGTVTGSSDARLKTNVERIAGALDKVRGLQGVYFDWKNRKGPRQIGFIAQDVAQFAPELVFQDTADEMFSVAYGNASALLVEAVKELADRVDALAA